MTADAWSRQLPSGPAPGESERGYIGRLQAVNQHIRENRQAAAEKGKAAERMGDADLSPRKNAIRSILDRSGVKAKSPTAQEPDKDRWLGAQIGDD